MTEQFKLYCFAQSGNAYKAALFLSLAELDWDPVFVDFFNGETRSEEFKKINVMLTSPSSDYPSIFVFRTYYITS